MAKQPVIDFKTVSLEYAVEKALEEVLAIDVENGVMTSDLAKALVKMGYPDKDVGSVARKLNGLAKEMTGTKARFLRTDPETGKTDKFVGVTWVGCRVAHEPWNSHLWHLPLWQNVNEIQWQAAPAKANEVNGAGT